MENQRSRPADRGRSAKRHMHAFTNRYRVIAAFVASALLAGESFSQQVDVAAKDEKRIAEHFILNPNAKRPPHYPAVIKLREIEAFLKTQRMLAEGCGAMTWEGSMCGMYCHDYEASKTPWLKVTSEFSASYAQTKTGTFLADFSLGQNRYARPDRKSGEFKWKHNYQPERARSLRQRVFFGGTSAARITLLKQIRKSFVDLDLTQFPTDRLNSLASSLAACQSDAEGRVSSLATELSASIEQALNEKSRVK